MTRVTPSTTASSSCKPCKPTFLLACGGSVPCLPRAKKCGSTKLPILAPFRCWGGGGGGEGGTGFDIFSDEIVASHRVFLHPWPTVFKPQQGLWVSRLQKSRELKLKSHTPRLKLVLDGERRITWGRNMDLHADIERTLLIWLERKS